MQYGIYQRTKPKMTVRKGWKPLEPLRGVKSAPVTDGEEIMSGMVMVLNWNSSNNRYEWTLADSAVAAHRAQVPYFAIEDYNTPDVEAIEQLPGLECSAGFEIQTGYFKTTGVPAISAGCPVTYGTGAAEGHLITCARGDGPTVPVLGHLTIDHHADSIDLTGEDSSATDLEVIRVNLAYDSQNAAS